MSREESDAKGHPDGTGSGDGSVPPKERLRDRLRRRVTGRLVIQVVLLGGLVYVAVPLVRELPQVFTSLRHANPLWLGVAALFTAGGYFSSAWALRACAGLKIPMTTGARLQVASGFASLTTPASVGGLALNVRFLTGYGPSASIATGIVGLQTLVQFLVHMGLLTILALFGGRSVAVLRDSPSDQTILVIVGAVLVVASVAAGIPRIRRLLADLWRRRGREAFDHLRALVKSPKRLSASALGAAGGTLSSVGAMWAVLIAVGGGDHPIVAAFVTMIGATLASAAPTPGGVGAVEAAIVATLTALGVPTGTAVAAMFGYRIVTTWIPAAVGAVIYRQLSQSKAI